MAVRAALLILALVLAASLAPAPAGAQEGLQDIHQELQELRAEHQRSSQALRDEADRKIHELRQEFERTYGQVHDPVEASGKRQALEAQIHVIQKDYADRIAAEKAAYRARLEALLATKHKDIH